MPCASVKTEPQAYGLLIGWLPWGNVFAITGTANLDARFRLANLRED